MSVAVVVVLVRWHEGVTVVVVTVADLWSARIGLVVEVIAVALADHPTVVVIIVLVWWQVTVAVAVATVADFWGAEIGRGELLVAVIVVTHITGWLAALAGSGTWRTVTIAISP